MPKITRKNCKPGFQTLESRQLMAGDVSVALFDGTLSIRADNAANGVEVVEVTRGVYSVQGFDLGGASTRINGGAAAFQANGVERINIFLYAGDDSLKVTGSTGAFKGLAEDLNIRGFGLSRKAHSPVRQQVVIATKF